jgi:hypothetical protein
MALHANPDGLVEANDGTVTASVSGRMIGKHTVSGWRQRGRLVG